MNFSMYSGVSSLIKQQGIDATAQIAVAHGFSSVELFDMAGKEDYAPVFGSVEEAKRAKTVLDHYGLSVSCYSVAVNLVTSNGEIREKAISDLKRYAEIAAAMGCPFLHHTLLLRLSLPANASSLDEVLPPVLDAACEVAHYCEGLGVTCLYEGHGMYFNGVDGFTRFYSEIKKRCRNVGVCGDLGNTVFVDESPVAFFQAYAAEIQHVHLKDYRIKSKLDDGEICKPRSRGGAYLESTVIGQGDVDIVSCLEILKAQGYNGGFSLEDDYCEPYTDHVSAAFATLRKVFD